MNVDQKPNFPTRVPAEICILFGEPPLLEGEDVGIYNSLMDRFCEVIAPQKVFEWFWCKDLTDHTWEVRRLRWFKVLIVELKRAEVRHTASYYQFLGPDDDDDGNGSPGAEQAPGQEERAEQMGAAEAGPDAENHDARPAFVWPPVIDVPRESAEMLKLSLNEYRSIDSLIASAEQRRDRTLRVIARHRGELAKQARQASDESTNGAARHFESSQHAAGGYLG
jgi:hypothetical protein